MAPWHSCVDYAPAVNKGEQMGCSQVFDVYVVADAGTVLGWIVGAED